MPKKTLYVREADLPIWEAAQKTLGEKSMSTLVTEALLEKLRNPVIDFNKSSFEWLHENGNRAVFTLVDLTADDETVIPRGSIVYVQGASSSNDRVDTVKLVDFQRSNQRVVMVPVEDIGSRWEWMSQGDGKTQVVASQQLKLCRDLCIAAFEAPNEESKRDRLLSLYHHLNLAIGVDGELDNPIVKYARDKWLAS